jgi:hypothetical protein
MGRGPSRALTDLAIGEIRIAHVKAPAAAVVATLAVAGCGHAGPSTGPAPAAVTYETHGLTVSLPRSWQRADVNLTPNLGDPRQALAVGTFPLRYRPTGCAHVPGSALEDMGARGAFVELEERGVDPSSSWPGFPPRPVHFGPRLGGQSEAAQCVPTARFTDHWFGITAGGRHFHVRVAFGPDTPAATREEAWTILDSLKVDPAVKPSWHATQ